MKIIITGSLGNISKPLPKELVQKGQLLEKFRLPPKIISDIVEIQAPVHKGIMAEEFFHHKYEVVAGNINLTDFPNQLVTHFLNPSTFIEALIFNSEFF